MKLRSRTYCLKEKVIEDLSIPMEEEGIGTLNDSINVIEEGSSEEENRSIKQEHFHHEVDLEEPKEEVPPINEDDVMLEENISDYANQQETRVDLGAIKEEAIPINEDELIISGEDLHHVVDLEKPKEDRLTVYVNEIMLEENISDYANQQETKVDIKEIKEEATPINEDDVVISGDDLHHVVDLEELKEEVPPINEDDVMLEENISDYANQQETEVDLEEIKEEATTINEDELIISGEDLHHVVDLEKPKEDRLTIYVNEIMLEENISDSANQQESNYESGVIEEMDWSETLQVEQLDEENMEDLDEKKDIIPILEIHNSESGDKIMDEGNTSKDISTNPGKNNSGDAIQEGNGHELLRVGPTESDQSEEQKLINEKLLECKICEKKFKNKNVLRKHLSIHTADENSFNCEQCTKKSNRQSHPNLLALKNKNLYECKNCHKKYKKRIEFKDKRNLQMHLLTQKKPEPNNPIASWDCFQKVEVKMKSFPKGTFFNMLLNANPNSELSKHCAGRRPFGEKIEVPKENNTNAMQS